MAPQLYDNKVLISTIPGSATNFYHPGALGIVYSLERRHREDDLEVQHRQGRLKLFGHPEVNSGGGLWFRPPSTAAAGLPGCRKSGADARHAQVSQRLEPPGPNLYTDSLVALERRHGQARLVPAGHAARHTRLRLPDLADHHHVPDHQRRADRTVIGAGKMGKVFAFRADNGKRLWTRNVGIHKYDSGPLPLKKPVIIEPGFLGGVETPMAASGNLVFVPWVDLCFNATATGIKSAGGLNGGTGGLAAVNSATGKVVWMKHLPSPASARPRLPTTSSSPLRSRARSSPSTRRPASCCGRPQARRHQLLPGRHQEHADHRRRGFGERSRTRRTRSSRTR